MAKIISASRVLTSDSTMSDALNFFKTKMYLEINTITLAKIISVDEDRKRLTIQSLINGTDSSNKPITPPTIYDVPYSCIRGGNAGIITKYVVGDNVVVGFCQRQIDITKETESQSTPNLFRFFHLQDAIVLSHWSNSEPNIYIKITNDVVEIQATSKPITISTTAKTTINANNAEINATQTTINGNLIVNGNATINGNASVEALTIDSSPFLAHTHSGVSTGTQNTGPVTP